MIIYIMAWTWEQEFMFDSEHMLLVAHVWPDKAPSFSFLPLLWKGSVAWKQENHGNQQGLIIPRSLWLAFILLCTYRRYGNPVLHHPRPHLWTHTPEPTPGPAFAPTHTYTHTPVSLSFGLLEFHHSFLHNISVVHSWSPCLHVEGGCYFSKRLNNARGRGWKRLEHGRQQHSFIACIWNGLSIHEVR